MKRGRPAGGDQQWTDDDMVAACLAGDERAWSALIDRYARYIYAVAQRACGLGPDAAEDVFQDACVRVYDGLRGFSGRGEFRSWLRAVVLSACHEHQRREARRPAAEIEQVDPGEVEALETALVVRAAVAGLGEPCATTVSLYFFSGLTQDEVARRLGVPSGTVAARLSRCVRRLRDALRGSDAAPARVPRGPSV